MRLLRILELQGSVGATLGQGAKARGFFQTLLTLDPEHKLPEGLPPRVRTPFYEAKGMVAEAPSMIFSAASRAEGDGLVLEATLSTNPFGLAQKARFHLRHEGGSWEVKDEQIGAEGARVKPAPGRLQWWVELLGQQDATLFSVGSAAKPFSEGVAAPAKVADGASTDVPEVVAPGSSSVSPAAWLCFGGAGLAVGGGIVAGLLSRGNHGQVDNAFRNANGVVTGMTQQEGAGLRAQARTQAIAANLSSAPPPPSPSPELGSGSSPAAPRWRWSPARVGWWRSQIVIVTGKSDEAMNFRTLSSPPSAVSVR